MMLNSGCSFNMVIFDLDQTLANTSVVSELRRAGRWSDVMKRVSSIEIYPGIHQLIEGLSIRKVPLAIVTKSPDMIPKAFVRHHGWPITIIVGYHQVKKRKPDPEGLLLAIKKAGIPAERVSHVGDHAEDTAAARAAGVLAIGAAWGSDDIESLRTSAPDHMFSLVDDLSEFLFQRYQ
jgi:HAD superfamily hydrolase (TIGR01549 family)